MNSDTQSVDERVRAHVYDATMRTGVPPTSAAVANTTSISRDAVIESFSRLAFGHMLVLQPGTGEILMANPFSAVPTPFRVDTDKFSAYGNCIWDALGIPAMLHSDARIITSCADCGEAAEIAVESGAIQGDGLLHFAIPAKQWWDDIVFT